MSDETRTVSRLVRANRPAPTTPPTAAEEPPSDKAPAQSRRSAPSRSRAGKERPKAAAVATPKHSITVSVPEGTRNRSRAAFRATQHLEDDESYSDFVSKAIDAEVVRREQVHNGGDEFPGGDRNLPSGRPLGS